MIATWTIARKDRQGLSEVLSTKRMACGWAFNELFVVSRAGTTLLAVAKLGGITMCTNKSTHARQLNKKA